METSQNIFLQTDALRVTADALEIDGLRYPMQKVVDAELVSESSYQSKTVPFVLTLGFVVWTLSELVNGTDDYTYAFIAALLAAVSMVAVRLAGRFSKHAAILNMPAGSVTVFRSHDRAVVAELVKAVNQAKDFRRPHYAEAWKVGKPVNG